MANRYLASLEKFGINLGLERISSLLEQLGRPQDSFRSIHVAGTNGKGSTCAIIASILKEAGYRVGLYTSPHLFDYTERIQINGADISRREFNYAVNKIKRIKKMKGEPTVFEVLTAAAFWYFARQKVDFAVVEAGMGGRLDATNTIAPIASVITNVDYEHTTVLGKTLPKIAAEKAGIIKMNTPVITAENKNEAFSVIAKTAKQNNSRMIMVTKGARKCRLVGDHQKINAACALAAIKAAGIKIPLKAVNAGLKKIKWNGRFQAISRKPLVIIDCAHNPAGIKALRKTIEKEYPKEKFFVLFGCQSDKNFSPMIKELNKIAARIIMSRSSHPRAVSFSSGRSIKEAAKLWNQNIPLLVTGSFFFVADFLRENIANFR